MLELLTLSQYFLYCKAKFPVVISESKDQDRIGGSVIHLAGNKVTMLGTLWGRFVLEKSASSIAKTFIGSDLRECPIKRKTLVCAVEKFEDARVRVRGDKKVPYKQKEGVGVY